MYGSKMGYKFDELLKSNEQVYTFINKLSELTDIIFFGGSVRDLYFDSLQAKPRDLDIVLSSIDEYKNIDNLINQFRHKKNRFGGYKVLINGLELDIWYLKNTWAFRNSKLTTSEENLINSVYLSIDGISYNYNKQYLNDDVFIKTENNRIIDIVLDENPHEELNLIRALVFKKRYKYNFSEKLVDRFKYFFTSDKRLVENLYNLQINHYKYEVLTFDEIKKEIKLIAPSNC